MNDINVAYRNVMRLLKNLKKYPEDYKFLDENTKSSLTIAAKAFVMECQKAEIKEFEALK